MGRERIWVWGAILINLAFALALLTQAWSRPAAPQEIDRAMEKADTIERPVRTQAVSIVLPSPPAPRLPVDPDMAPSESSEVPVAVAEEPEPVQTAADLVAPTEPLPVPTTAQVVPVADPEPEEITRVQASGLATGRVLLRVLEHGSGPGIEIAWPAETAVHGRLYRLLIRCHGMRLALMDGEGRLYGPEEEPGRPWQLNLDRYSGFVRQAQGRLVRAEEAEADQVRRHHGGLRGSVPVRIFPRDVDALLLGGLRSLIGPDYRTRTTVRAEYLLNGERILIGNLMVDGRGVAGRIDLSGRAPRCGSDRAL